MRQSHIVWSEFGYSRYPRYVRLEASLWRVFDLLGNFTTAGVEPDLSKRIVDVDGMFAIADC